MDDARHEVVRRGYDEIADRYLATRATGGDLELLPELAGRLSSGDAVLDAGCGAGVPVTTQLVDADLEVVGIDLSSAQVRLAGSHNPGAHIAQADLVALPFGDRSFEGLVSYYAVIHVPRSEHRAVFDEFRRVLVTGGVALLCLGAGDVAETTIRRVGWAPRCSGATSTPTPTWRCCGLPGSTSFDTSSSKTP
jgi:ubiquinone/menaquinone biosynthesis C-methylase UbiE